MRKHLIPPVWCILAAAGILTAAEKNFSPQQVYSSGKARLILERILDDKRMPEEVFFESVDDLTTDKGGNIYVLDHLAGNIKKFDPEGKFLEIIGSKGQGPGEFNWPTILTVSQDRLLVWDSGHRRIQVYSLEGAFLTSKKFPVIRSKTEMVFPSLIKMKALPNGDLIIQKEMKHYGEEENPQECTIDVYSPDLEHKNTLFSAAVWRERIIMLSGANDVIMPYPVLAHWDILPDGKIVIGFSERYEIGIYDPVKGQIAAFTHTYTPVKITEEDKRIFFDSTKYWYSRMGKTGMMEYPKKLRKYATFPRFKPAFHRIIADSDGNILVFGYSSREGGSLSPQFFDVFSRNGRFLKKVYLDNKAPRLRNKMMLYNNSFFWIKEKDENDLIKIVKYRISG